MSDHPARRLWLSVEAIHDVVYFADGVRDAGVGLGLRGFWMTYFAFRAAPLGPVGPAIAVATFAGFHPDMVAKSLPGAWTRVSPATCVATRAEVSAAALRDAGVERGACAAAVERLTPMAANADPTGRPLFAANTTLPRPGDPMAALWQVATTVREHRGDGHVAALVGAGVSGVESHLLQVAAGRFPSEAIRSVRGWTAEDWARATGHLRDRHLLSARAEPTLTDEGRRLLAEIETLTDEVAWTGGQSALGEAGVDEVVSILRPAVEAVRGAGLLPEFNPTGLPSPTSSDGH